MTLRTPEARRPRIVCLAGFMGSGKTTVGKLLAAQTGRYFVDLDDRIEQRAGISILDFFERHGEAMFRTFEEETLAQVLGESLEKGQTAVIALGGGTYAQPGNQVILREQGAAVVWLECPIEELLSRCATITNRPLFRDEASFRDLYLRRLPSYQLADYRVDSSREPRSVLAQILALDIFERVTA
jgi:shikimate kinase